jgi:hypothetical protein
MRENISKKKKHKESGCSKYTFFDPKVGPL